MQINSLASSEQHKGYQMQNKHTLLISTILLFAACGFGQTYVSGAVSGVWDASGNPYYVTDSVCVPRGMELRIEPGCRIIFDGHYKFCVDTLASFKAIGTARDSIWFYSEDTLVAYDIGGFAGIRFYGSAPGCSLLYCDISKGRAGVECDVYGGGGLFLRSFVGVVKHCRFTHCIAGRDRPPASRGGAAIRIEGRTSDVLVEQCEFSDGYTYMFGGGISVATGDALIKDCYFHDNIAGTGGGIDVISRGDVQILNNTITNNRSLFYGAGIHVGGTYAEISGNSITYNSSDQYAGGIKISEWDNSSIKRNLISHNIASEIGGGIYCVDSRNFIANNIIANNSAYYGGGIIIEGWYSYIDFVSNTVVKNEAYEGGGVCIGTYSGPNLINNIFYKNEGVLGNDVHLGDPRYPSMSCTCFVAYNLLDSSECYIVPSSNLIWGDGNCADDPRFSDTLYFNPLPTSVVLNRGTSGVYSPIAGRIINAPLYDFFGNPRPFGDGYDIGAIEFTMDEIQEFNNQVPEREILITPNPFREQVTVDTGTKGRWHLKIYDLEGREIYRTDNPPLVWKPAQGTEGGVYIAVIKGSTFMESRKVVYLK